MTADVITQPISLDAAYSIGLWAGLLDLRGVAIVGRPVARGLDDGQTLGACRMTSTRLPLDTPCEVLP